MLFNSLEFLVFFPTVVVGFFALRQRWRWLWLLVASCYFYMVFVPAYILILAGTIIVDYFAGILIERASGTARKRWLSLSIAANVGVLGLFKYYNFLNDSLGSAFAAFGMHFPVTHLGIVLPVGLSFHTFQAMSYTIEVYRGKQKAERHFGIFALYVMFFPQLVAGPIERPQNLLHQLKERHRVEFQRISDGLKLIAGGLIKKVVIADGLANYVNAVYAHPQDFSGAPLIVATVFYAFQIYCDFSGYSDIAIGSAQVLGVRLMTNFQSSYFSRSVAEFWRRWHISLCTWFRDYLYIPLGGSRVAMPRWYLNLFLTFLISGLWHGANWTFVAWGALNGIYLLVGLSTAGLRARLGEAIGLDRAPALKRTLQIVTTFMLICASWVLFRAESFSDAAYIFTNLFGGSGIRSVVLPEFDRSRMVTWVALIFGLLLVEGTHQHVTIRQRLAALPPAYRWSLYYAACMLIVTFGSFGGRQAFIYFQF